MKKILTAVFAFAIMSTASFAQKSKISTPKNPKAKTETPAQIPSAKTQKKDGTPDMRYKENKSIPATPNTKHLKKDGTPDMRYKENKMNKPATAPAKAK